MELFHIDDQIQKIAEIRRDYGSDVKVETLSEDNIFSVASLNGVITVAKVKEEMNLVSYREYHEEALDLREKALKNL
jgi:hypothetical protein